MSDIPEEMKENHNQIRSSQGPGNNMLYLNSLGQDEEIDDSRLDRINIATSQHESQLIIPHSNSIILNNRGSVLTMDREDHNARTNLQSQQLNP